MPLVSNLLFIITLCFILVLIWDDAQKDKEKKFVLELTFAQPVLAVRMRHTR